MDLPDDIPEYAITWQFVRASGPGGQNVNKVATAVQLRLHVPSTHLPDDVKERLLKQAGNRATTEQEIIINAERFRSQVRNRIDAVERLDDLIASARQKPKKRIATRPSRAAKTRRLSQKNQRSVTKGNRRKPSLD